MTKIQDYLIAAVFGALMLYVGTLYERHQGAAACVAGDVKVSAKQDIKNAAAQGAAGGIVKEEATSHATAIATPVAPTPTLGRVQLAAKPSCAKSSVPAPAAGSQPEADPLELIRITGPTGRLRADLDAHVRSEVQRARDADDQIAQLWDYAMRVCPPPK